ncbi:Signal transduction histidine kinase [Anaerovibrio sp. JC8]|uniref:transporter substrate-binding domain-containing protein n=1 Tax=Anaerovibrio sp. JC8 TaxID=1240085 RepID=UPI000A0A27B2|nr:transporter substrate-binding domain-containing protein [Anaerovibrio sp. JC8]ORT99308.1 Signal transduction histidine kinase [Anaerovibrio sp. JC8]
MIKNRSTLMRLIMVIVICLVMLPARGIHADEAPIKRQPVDVGIVVQPGIAMPTDTGVYYGFDAEFMYKIAQYANLKVIYHPYKNNVEMFQALRDGEIQMALGISPNPERLQQFLFANNGFFTGQASIRVRKDDARFSYGNPAEFDGKRIGVVKLSIMYDRAKEWAEKSNIHPEFVIFDSDQDMYDAMDSGAVDAIVATGTKYANSYRASFNIATNTYYPIFNRNEVALKNKVDAAMNRILYEDALYPEKLFDKYRHFQVREGLPLSVEEKQYIADHPVLRVGLLENQPPFSYIDNDGNFRGITPDLYRKIGQELNWQVEFVPFKNRADILIAIHSKDIDLYGVTTQDIIASESKGLALTKTYFTLNMVYLRRSDAETVHSAAYIGKVPANVEKMLKESFPEVDFHGYSTLEECYDAMMAHQVDAVFCNMAQLNWLTIKRGSGSFLVEGVDNLYTECSGQLLPENYLLNSILSKTVSGSNIDVTSIISHNIYTGQTTMDYLRSIPTRLVVIFFTVILFITIIVSYSMYTTHKQRVQAELSVKQAALDASEQARQAESSFLSTMSHDMRTPLNGILGYTRLARGTQNLDEIQQYLERIDSSSKLMLALVNDVLDLSKLSSGKMELREDRIVPRELFNIIKDAITMNANNHHIDFKAEIHVDDDVVVYADRLRLQQLAMNLLSNAVKYTQAGGHVVWDVHVNADGDKSTLVEIVQDDGIGMSEEFQRRMFDVFSQENREETVNTRGTGLGLSLVHKFITMMGGSIEVESKVDEGTTFIFTVPIKTVREDAKALALEGKYGADSGEEISKELLKDVPILLVEDNEINAELAQLMLADYGANIIDWAHDGQQAVDFYSASERSHYKLILMDLRMPVMDGLTATRTIRMLHRPDAGIVPIIAMSADAYEADIRNCMEAGMQCHISKPVDINKLMKAIKDVL